MRTAGFIILLFTGFLAKAQGIVYLMNDDTAAVTLSWKNLVVHAMDLSKYGLPENAEARSGGEASLDKHINSIFILSEKDLAAMQKIAGSKTFGSYALISGTNTVRERTKLILYG